LFAEVEIYLPMPFMGVTMQPCRDCTALSDGFKFFSLFDFVYAINPNKKNPCSSVLMGKISKFQNKIIIW